MASLVRFVHKDRALIWLFRVLAATTLLSCDEKYVTAPADIEPPRAVAISITPTVSILLVGEVASLSAIAVYSSGQKIRTVGEWSSTNPDIATVGQTNGNVTAVGVGLTTVTVTSEGLVATATITVLEYHPAARLIFPLDELILTIGSGQHVTVMALDGQGRLTPAPVAWASENPESATIGRSDGQVTAIALGSTTLVATAGATQATLAVEVVPENLLMQWASTATASSQYEHGNGPWAPAQATGAPNVASCDEESNAWASGDTDLDWLELEYQTPVRPLEIRVYEVWAPGSIVKIELKDTSGAYHTVYTSSPQFGIGCLRTLRIPITTFTEPITAVRLTVDQRTKNDWNEIDAVRLLGYPIN